MMHRRNVLTSLVAGAAVLPSVTAGSVALTLPDVGQETSANDCSGPPRGPYADYFPNLVVSTHEQHKALFYDDLLRGKTVLINCMSVKNDAVYPVTANLARVQRLLGDRVGREIFMYSLTVDPEHDTPRVLQAFAARYGVGPGWLFLTGRSAVIQVLRDRLFARGDGHDHSAGPVQDGAMGLVRYGNEAVGLWGSVPAKTDPEWIVRRLTWVEARQPAMGTPKRRGPIVLVAEQRR